MAFWVVENFGIFNTIDLYLVTAVLTNTWVS